MKIALYYPWIYLKGGGERLICELLRHSRHEWTLFTNHFDRERTFADFSNYHVVELKPVSVKREMKEVLKATVLIAGQKLPADDFDARCVVIDSIGSFVNVRNRDLPHFAICLTPLRVIYDPHYSLQYSAQKKIKDNPVINIGKSVFRFCDRWCWQYYRKVFCISWEVKRRIEASGIVATEKLQVNHPGINLDLYKPGDGTSKRYFLLPGRIMWTKNIELGIEAFRRFCQDNSGFELYIAGIVDAKSQEYFKKLQDLSRGLPVKFLTELNDPQMLELYQNAFAVLFTPFNEDWGFIPLEAMACGKPCIAVNRGGPKESIVDGKTGILVEPEAEAFALAMDRLAHDQQLVDSLKVAGLVHVHNFSWSNFAGEIDRYIDKIKYN